MGGGVNGMERVGGYKALEQREGGRPGGGGRLIEGMICWLGLASSGTSAAILLDPCCTYTPATPSQH